VAEVTTHRDVVPELRKLAQAFLDGVDPAVRAAAARAFAGGPARCQQVWCPVCALAALMAGEQHPLLGVVADHSVSLLSTIRTLLDDMAGAADGAEPSPPDGGGDAAEPAGNGAAKSRYQPITISVED
jgi:hypothetical protein